MPDLVELEVPIRVVPTSERGMITKSKERMVETETLNMTKTQMMTMIMKKVKMRTLQMLMDTYCQETALINSQMLS